MISILVLVGLAVVWAIVIFPDVVRWVSNNRRGDTIRTFNSQLSSLGRTNAVLDDRERSNRLDANTATGNRNNVIELRDRMVAPAVPGPPQSVTPQRPAPKGVSPAVRKRRQDVLVALGAACLLTLLATIAFGPVFLYLHLIADALLVGYLLALQHVVSGGAASRRQTSMGNTLSPVGGFADNPAVGMHTQVVEPRRIAN